LNCSQVLKQRVPSENVKIAENFVCVAFALAALGTGFYSPTFLPWDNLHLNTSKDRELTILEAPGETPASFLFDFSHISYLGAKQAAWEDGGQGMRRLWHPGGGIEDRGGGG
jgi:hypothetical protein